MRIFLNNTSQDTMLDVHYMSVYIFKIWVLISKVIFTDRLINSFLPMSSSHFYHYCTQIVLFPSTIQRSVRVFKNRWMQEKKRKEKKKKENVRRGLFLSRLTSDQPYQCATKPWADKNSGSQTMSSVMSILPVSYLMWRSKSAISRRYTGLN